ncbi:hypothetical protein D9M68_697370 [compost metagenome]
MLRVIEDVWQFPAFARSAAGWVVPKEQDAVALNDVPFTHLLRNPPLLTRDEHVLAPGVPLPAVVGAGYAVALYLAAVAQMGAHVRAVGVEHGQIAGIASKGYQVMAEVLHRLDAAWGDFRTPADLEPAGGLHGQVEHLSMPLLVVFSGMPRFRAWRRDCAIRSC